MAIQSGVSAVVGLFLRTHDSLRLTLFQENLEEREVDLWRAFDCRSGSGMCTELETTHICIFRRYRETSYAISPVDREESPSLTKLQPLKKTKLMSNSPPGDSVFFSTLLGQFWNRWKREYVVDLREHHKSSQIVARENLEGLRRGILETTVSLEELLLKLLWTVARENVWEDPYKICLR